MTKTFAIMTALTMGLLAAPQAFAQGGTAPQAGVGGPADGPTGGTKSNSMAGNRSAPAGGAMKPGDANGSAPQAGVAGPADGTKGSKN